MEIKRTTEIFVRSDRRIVLHQPCAEQIICPFCGAKMFAAEAIAAALGISCREIYRQIETGAVHFIETVAGAALICQSLIETKTGEKTRQLKEE